MNPNSIPQQLANIPYGQIFILTRPTGITGRTHHMIWKTLRIARHCHQEPILHTMPIENPELWECAVCKIGDDVIIADKDSLLEMLCELWGLDYDDVRSNIDFRYRPRIYPIEGEIHPTRVPLDAEPISNEDDDLTLECLQVPEKTDTLERIRSAFKDNFSYNLGISKQDTSELYDYEEAHKRTYTLDIQIDKGKYTGRYYKKYGKCDIYLVDNTENKEYELQLEAENKAIYLTYIMLKDGIEYSQVSYSEEFYNIYSQLHNKMPRASGFPKKWDLEQKAQMDTFSNYISKIRKAIYNVAGEYKPVELFAVEGDRKGVYKVKGATDELRELIREKFELK